MWFALGGCISSVANTISESRPKAPEDEDLPEDMSATSLVGGGLVAGEAIYALAVGVFGLAKLVTG